MLSNKITKIIGKKIAANYLEIFNSQSVDFLADISNELKRNKKTIHSPDLFYLMLWSSKRNLLNLKKKYQKSSYRVGRGILFHICPSNVPLNFFYSFAYGILSGNSNIVKIPSKRFTETDILLKTINTVINKKKYVDIKKTNIFIKYERNRTINDFYSSICDGRIVWGGDKTIEEIRKSQLKTKSIELTFSDRFSLSVINIDKLKKVNGNNLQKIIKGFFYDSYTMKQLACNSPHFIFWIGKKDNLVIENFWTVLSKIVSNQNTLDLIDMTNKYNHICDQFINLNKLSNFKNFDNYVYVADFKKNKIDHIRGLNGIFYQKYKKKLNDLKKSINHKCQTITYFGFEKNELINFLKQTKTSGIDRIVPVGKSMSVNLTWDGFDMIKSLSRIIEIQ
jgi:hypothetical protein